MKKLKSERSFIVMLITLTCSYLVLYSSTFVWAAIANVLVKDDEELAASKKEFFFQFRHIPLLVNNCSNFFFYYASGAKFRVALREMVRSWFKGKNKNDASKKQKRTADKTEDTPN